MTLKETFSQWTFQVPISLHICRTMNSNLFHYGWFDYNNIIIWKKLKKDHCINLNKEVSKVCQCKSSYAYC